MLVLPAAFLNMLCSLRYGIYIFFGFWQFVAIIFTYFLVPETRGVAIEEVSLCLYLCNALLLHHECKPTVPYHSADLLMVDVTATCIMPCDSQKRHHLLSCDREIWHDAAGSSSNMYYM